MTFWQAGLWEGRVREVGEKNPEESCNLGVTRQRGAAVERHLGSNWGWTVTAEPFSVMNSKLWMTSCYVPFLPTCWQTTRKANADVIVLDKLLRDPAWSLGSVEKRVLWLPDSSGHKCPIHWILDPTRAGYKSVNPWDRSTYSFIFLPLRTGHETLTWGGCWGHKMTSAAQGMLGLKIFLWVLAMLKIPKVKMTRLGLGKWVPWVKLLPHKDETQSLDSQNSCKI